MLITRTPLRVSLFGGGSDLPGYYSQFGGSVFSFAVNRYIYISAHPLVESPDVLLKYSLLERVDDVDQIKHPVFREVIRRYRINSIDIGVSSDIPAGTGLGSSSSFTVGVLNTLRHHVGLTSTKRGLAEEACEVEIERLGEPIGVQDQFVAAFGGCNLLTIARSGHVSVESFSDSSEFNSLIQKNIILVRVPGTRSASDLLRAQRERISEPQQLKIYHELRDIAIDGVGNLARGPEYLGGLLNRSWILKRTLSAQVSNPAIDEMYSKLLADGAYGGKLLGAGGAGYFLVIAPQLLIENLEEDQRYTTIRPGLDLDGSKIIYDSTEGDSGATAEVKF